MANKLVIFLVTLILGFAGFYSYNRWFSAPANTTVDLHDSLHLASQHIEGITPEMDFEERLKLWSNKYASDMSNEMMSNMKIGQSSELSFRVRALNYNEKSNICVVEVYTSWLEKKQQETNYYEVVVQTVFNLRSKTVSASLLNKNEPFEGLISDKKIEIYIEQSMISSLQYLQEII
jgi:hypothetical protein